MPEAIDCIFCHQDRSFVALEENGYQGKKCAECDLIYISPRPTEQETLDLYGHSNAVISAHSHIKDSLLKRLHARHSIHLISKYKKNGSLLEIGAGGGFFLDEARKKGYAPYGIELNPIQASFITEQLYIPCEQKPLSEQSFGCNFDIIYHCDVLSHLHDPVKEMRIAYQKLKPGGIVVFETGNIGEIDPRWYDLFEQFQYPDHLFFFSEKNIEALLAASGFKLVRVYRYAIAPQLKFMRRISRFLKTGGQKKTHVTNVPKNSFIKKMLIHGYHFMLHSLRYYLGALLPKKRRPLTLIVIAQKIG